jgi:hypothetical protein
VKLNLSDQTDTLNVQNKNDDDENSLSRKLKDQKGIFVYASRNNSLYSLS